MSYLPEGYQELKSKKAYLKLKDGENRIRIVTKPIAGWIDWEDKKPYRYRPSEKPSSSFDIAKPLKAFWACHVWDYAQNSLFILEITQSGILKVLTELGEDEAWGDFTRYDIKITKTGSQKETKYTVTPIPPKPLTAAIESAIRQAPVRLEALYEGRDPWTDLEPMVEVHRMTGEVLPSIGSPLATLREHLQIDGIDTAHLDAYLNSIVKAKKQSLEQIIAAALRPELLPKFKSAYVRESANYSQENQLAV